MLTLAKYPTFHAQNQHCPLTYYKRKVVVYFFSDTKDTTLFFLRADKINKGNVSLIQSCKIANDFALSYSKKV